jgi:hypothetical protein
MDDPVRDSCGHTFERGAILSFLSRRPYCPISRKPLSFADLAPNDALSERMDKWKWQQEYYYADCSGGGMQRHVLMREFVDVELQAPPPSSSPHASNVSCDVARDDDGGDSSEGDGGVPVPPPRRRWKRFRGHAYGRVRPHRLSGSQGSTAGTAASSCDHAEEADGITSSYPLSGAATAGQVGPSWESPATMAAELMLLPQELHVLRMMKERSRTEDGRRKRARAVRAAARLALVATALLAAAVLSAGLLWQFGYLLPRGQGDEVGENPDAMEDEYVNETLNRTTL